MKYIRILALYGIVSLPILWTLGITSKFAPGVQQWLDGPDHQLPMQVWGVSVVLSLLVTYGAAIRTVARDDRMSSSTRAIWIVALVAANLAAGAIFVLSRGGRTVAPRD